MARIDLAFRYLYVMISQFSCYLQPPPPPFLDVYVGDYGNQNDAVCVSGDDFLGYGNILTCNGTLTGRYLTFHSTDIDVDLNLCEVKVLGSCKWINMNHFSSKDI